MASAKKKKQKKLEHQFYLEDSKSVSSWISNESPDSSAPPPLAHGQLDLRWLEKYQKIGS